MSQTPSVKTMIRRRPRVSIAIAVVLSVLFSVFVTPVLLAESWVLSDAQFETGFSSPAVIRSKAMSASRAQGAWPPDLRFGATLVVSKGDTLGDRTSAAAQEVLRQAKDPFRWFAIAFALFVSTLLFCLHMRGSHRGKLLRTQAATLLMTAGLILLAKVTLLMFPLSPLVLPVAVIAVLATAFVDVSVGLAVGLISALCIAGCVPFDATLICCLALQACTAVLFCGSKRKSTRRNLFLSGVFGGGAALVGYLVMRYLETGMLPSNLIALDSPYIACLVGGALSGLLAMVLQDAYQYFLGNVTSAKLVALEDLSHPLLKKIASNAPGTWQHSLAMANMAEIAANTIGADGRLVRVGAYFHDLGKALQPEYFIENLRGGECSPHDDLDPEVSCDAIFAHVTEGVLEARRSGLPERVIDFMHMHHGNGLLEYFWGKCQDEGNPKQYTKEDFRYPGIPPQSRETAILAICDAVEAASRTLRTPDEDSIENLVRRIVYGKLDLGQLDESGLSMSELRRIAQSLAETIRHAHHGRIEYPWQKAENAAPPQEGGMVNAVLKEDTGISNPGSKQRAITAAGNGVGRAISRMEALAYHPPLDSLDAPRPYWRQSRRDGSAPFITEDEVSAAFREPVPSSDSLGGAPELEAADNTGKEENIVATTSILPKREDEIK